MKRLILVIALCGLIGCGNLATVGTPVPPNSAQTQVLNITRTLHDAVDAAVKTAIRLRDAGTISAADTRAVENWSLSVLDLNDSMLAELGSGDAWTIQKQKLLLSLVGFKLPVATSSPILQSALASVSSIIQQIQGQVSQ